MESFGMLKFWQNATADDSGDETDGDDSLFDLEFTVPRSDEKVEKKSGSGDDFAAKNGDSRYRLPESRAIAVPEAISKPQSPMSLLRSPSKFRVCTLGFKKSTSEKTETISKNEVPIFTRDNSLRSKIMKERSDGDDSSKRFPKDVVRKYLKLIKPLYVSFSKRYGENVKFSEHSARTTPSSSPATAPIYSPRKQVDEKQNNRPAALRVVCKHLGKSRSAISTVVTTTSRRDDSLLQQHDGIQSAILHCKRSFNSSTRSSILSRSVSDTCQEKSIRPMRKSSDEQNRCSI